MPEHPHLGVLLDRAQGREFGRVPPTSTTAEHSADDPRGEDPDDGFVSTLVIPAVDPPTLSAPAPSTVLLPVIGGGASSTADRSCA